MQFLYACTKESGVEKTLNCGSLSLQVIMTLCGPYCLAVVAEEGNDCEGAAQIIDETVRDVTEWFYKEAVPLLCQNKSAVSVKRSFFRIIIAPKEKKIERNVLNFTVLLLGKKVYYLFCFGKGYCYKIGKKVEFLTSINGYGNRRCKYFGEHSFLYKKGRYSKADVFLLCDRNFVGYLEGKSFLVFQHEKKMTERKLQRLMQEIIARAETKGVKQNCTAIILKRN